MKSKEEGFEEFTRREFLQWSGMGAAGLALAGVPGLALGAEKKPKYGGRLRVGERYAPTGLDAHKNQFTIDYFLYLLTYNGLAIMGPLPEVAMYPDLAKSWEVSNDGREYTFSLREGVKFHHGKELDSGDVKYSIERVMNPATRSPRAFAYRWIDSVNPLDKYHLKIRLKEPYAPFLTTMTIQTCPIIPAGWEPTGIKPAPGTGPFVFKSFVPNESVELGRFEQYWEVDEKTGDRFPYLDSFYMKKIPDDIVRWTALRTGDLDYITAPPQRVVVEELKKATPGIVSPPPKPLGFCYIFFNVSKPPFDQKKVRHAIAYAVDKNELVQAALWGLGVPLNNQPFLTGSRMYIPIKDREQDLAKAKQLLAEAGYPHGFKLEFAQYAHPSTLHISDVLIAQLKKIGIDGTIQIVDRAPHFARLRKGEFAISVMNENMRLDPDDAFYLYLHSGEIGKNNWSRYGNKELDQLLEKGRTTWKWEERVPIYQKAVEIIKEDLPVLFLLRFVTPLAYRDYVKGFEAGAGTWFGYYGGGMKKAWLDK